MSYPERPFAISDSRVAEASANSSRTSAWSAARRGLRRLPGDGEGIGQPPPVEVVHGQPVDVNDTRAERCQRPARRDRYQLHRRSTRPGAVADPQQHQDRAEQHDHSAGRPGQQQLPDPGRQLAEKLGCGGALAALGRGRGRGPLGDARSGRTWATAVTAAIRRRQSRVRPGRLATETKEMRDRAQRSRTAGQPRDQQGWQASMARARPAASVAARLTSQARSAPRSRSSGFSHSSAPRGRRRPGCSVPHQNRNSRAGSRPRHRRQPPAQRGDRGGHPARAGRDQNALARAAASPRRARTAKGRGERDDERAYRPEQQRKDTDQERRPVRRDVPGVVTKIALLRGAGGVRMRRVSRGQGCSPRVHGSWRYSSRRIRQGSI